MALNFPQNPTEGQTHFDPSNGVTYTYKNGGWVASGGTQDDLDLRYVEVAGDNMTGSLTLGTDKITLNAANGSITAYQLVHPGYGSYGFSIAASTAGRYVACTFATDGSVAGNDNRQAIKVVTSDTGVGSNTKFAVSTIGDVYIGGTISNTADTSVPNTILKADGSINADGVISSGDFGSAAGKEGGYLWKGNGSGSQLYLFSNNTDQSAISVSSSPDALTAKTSKFKVRNNGELRIGNDTSNPGPPGNLNIRLYNNGTSEFAGDMAIGTSGSFTPSTPAISLNADGSGQFAGSLGVGVTPTRPLEVLGAGKFGGPADAHILISPDGGSENRNTILSRDGITSNSGSNLVIATGDAGTKAVVIRKDGNVSIGLDAKDFDNSNPPISLNADGTIKAGAKAIFGDARSAGTDGGFSTNEGKCSSYQVAYDFSTITYTTSQACYQTVCKDVTDSGDRKVTGQWLGNGSIRLQPNGSQTQNILLNATDGSAEFSGAITADNVTFNLEADDDTKYTATTNEDGEETLVYNGATLDVKDRLTKLDTALTGLKAALVSTTDHDSLKTALIAALADI